MPTKTSTPPQRPLPLKEAMKGLVPPKVIPFLPTSFDLLGEIMILEIKDQVIPYEKKIAQTYLSMHKQIKVVCKRTGHYTGKYRLRKLKILVGERRKTTTHKENGCVFTLHAESCYFSVRSATERQRIADLVKPDETVLVLFSGVAPFPIILSKHSKAKEIIGVELNPVAHKFAQENIRKNKCMNVTLYCGDVKKIVPTLLRKHKTFSRVLMPLPKGGESFLDIAIRAVSPGGILHFYDFLHDDEFDLASQKVKNAAQRAGRTVTLLGIHPCGQYAPHTYRICVDAQIS